MGTLISSRLFANCACIPLSIASEFAVVASPAFRKDLRACIDVCADPPEIPEKFIEALVAAEDHRFMSHPGVDILGLVRAAYSVVFRRRVQGASTIEQQFVRTVTGRYERTLRRKFREQLLAIQLSRSVPKSVVSRAYLSIAYYGAGLRGLSGLETICGSRLLGAGRISILQAISRLKYPEPSRPTDLWHKKLSRRVRYTQRRLGGPWDVARPPVNRLDDCLSYAPSDPPDR